MKCFFKSMLHLILRRVIPYLPKIHTSSFIHAARFRHNAQAWFSLLLLLRVILQRVVRKCKTGRRLLSSGNLWPWSLSCFLTRECALNSSTWIAPLQSQVKVPYFSECFPVFWSTSDFLLQQYLTPCPGSVEQRNKCNFSLYAVLSLSFVGTDVVTHIGHCSLQVHVWSY